MILIALGSNLPSRRFGGPVGNCGAALEALNAAGVAPVRVSRWYRSAPVPASDQPWFINGVAVVDTALPPDRLLAVLHDEDRTQTIVVFGVIAPIRPCYPIDGGSFFKGWNYLI